MSNDLTPQTAWQTFVPERGQWNAQLVRHFYRRAGFAASPTEISAAMKSTPGDLAESLVAQETTPAFEAEMDKVGKLILTGRDPKPLAAWWLYCMAHTPDQLLEKSTFFWHGHFAASAEKVANVAAMLRYYDLLKRCALGSFEEMAQGISRDAAILIYLDSTENRKTHPNENYARELMELFCLGLDHYQEKDIQEIARCFTGWEVKRAQFRFNKYQHDNGNKTIFDQTGNFSGEDAVRMIVNRPAAAKFIAAKLVRFYIADEPGISDEFIDPLASQLSGNDFNIGQTISTILSSNIFYSELSLCRKVRSPVEMVISLLRTTGCRVNFHELARQLEQVGQLPFYPPNVKGWDGGRKWINSSTLIARSNLVRSIVRGSDTNWRDGDAAKWLKRSTDTDDVPKQVDWLLSWLVPKGIAPKSRDELLRLATELKLDRPNGVADLICAISVLPEFHLN